MIYDTIAAVTSESELSTDTIAATSATVQSTASAAIESTSADVLTTTATTGACSFC